MDAQVVRMTGTRQRLGTSRAWRRIPLLRALLRTCFALLLLLASTASRGAFSLRLGGVVTEGVNVYVGGGGSYNTFDVDSGSGLQWIAAEEGMTVEELQQVIADVEAAGALFTSSAELDVDDAWGYHVCGGIEFDISENMQLFAEYRYSVVEIEGEAELYYAVHSGGSVLFDQGAREKFEDDYDFGLVRVGLNIVL